MKLKSNFRFLGIVAFLATTVLFNSCKKDEDPFNIYDNGKTIIPKTTKVITDSNFSTSLISIDSTSYTLTFNAANIPGNINVGDIIVSGVGDGLLRKVTKISNSSNQVVLQTEKVSFSDGFQKADLEFNSSTTTKKGDLDNWEIEYIHEGVKLNNLGKGSLSIYELLRNISFDLILDGDGHEETISDQVQLSGTFSLNQDYKGEIKIDNNNLQKLYLEYAIEEQLDLSASCPVAEVDLKKEIKFAQIKYPRIYCTIGPVPVIVRPILTLYFGVDFDVSSSIATSVNQAFSFNTGVTWESGSWTKFADVEKSFNFQPPTLSAEAKTEVYIRPELEMKFYGSIAPNLSVPVYDRFSADASGNPWWTLTSGLKGDIGISIGIFDKQLMDYSTNLFDISFPIAQASGPFPIKPIYLSSAIENASPSVIELTYDLTLANIVPSASAFIVQVNSVNRTVNSVAISGTKVILTLASPVVLGDIVTVAYNKPATNPLQTAPGGQATSMTAQTVTNNVGGIKVTGITITGAGGPTVINTDNGTLQLNATVTPANAANKTVTWSITSGTDKASISSTGLVTALDNGTAAVRATANDGSGVYGTLVITISNQVASGTGIIFNPNKTYGSLSDIDGNIYKTIEIGTQTWMAENLKATKYNDGTAIPPVTDNKTWSNMTTPCYCWYNNDEVTYKNTYGALYNWYAVNTGTLCPTGWHVPSNAEWHNLALTLDANSKAVTNFIESDIAGGKLKETGTTHWVYNNSFVTNETGFTALPGGYRLTNDVVSFYSIGSVGVWWSSSVLYQNSTGSISREMFSSTNTLWNGSYGQKVGLSVRCLKD
jgi:uncharacterized protein (TIGR02145 family)